MQLALEILTGACATLPDPESDVPSGQADEDEDGDEGTQYSYDDLTAS